MQMGQVARGISVCMGQRCPPLPIFPCFPLCFLRAISSILPFLLVPPPPALTQTLNPHEHGDVAGSAMLVALGQVAALTHTLTPLAVHESSANSGQAWPDAGRHMSARGMSLRAGHVSHCEIAKITGCEGVSRPSLAG